MKTEHTPGPWYYVSGAAWTTPGGPDDGGQCVAMRASKADIAPWVKDRNLQLAAAAPALLEALERAQVILRGAGPLFKGSATDREFSALIKSARGQE